MVPPSLLRSSPRPQSRLAALSLLVWSLGPLGRDRVEAGGVLIQIRNPARDEDDVGVADVSLILLPVGRFSSSLTGSLSRHLGVGVRI